MYIRPNFDKVLKQALYIIAIAFICGVVNNLLFARIPWFGSWSPKVLPSGITVPPSYEEGKDAPVINLSEAMTAYNSGGAIFLDARTMEDYKAGHIKGAIQLYMEEFEVEYAEVKDLLPKDALIITYCGGDECELSLFLTRNLKAEGFTNLKVFFGGWQEWVEAKLPTSTGENP